MRLEVRLVVIKEYQIYKLTFIECRFKIVHENILSSVQYQVKDPHSPLLLELARLVSSLLYGALAMLVLNLQAFKNRKYTAYDHSMETVRMAKS